MTSRPSRRWSSRALSTRRIKVDAVAARGAQVVLHGDSYSDAYTRARRLQRRRGLAFVHPYDDPEVIAGQGTIGVEIVRQHAGAIDALFVPVGGGLISGIAAYVKRVRPSTRIINLPLDWLRSPPLRGGAGGAKLT